MPCKTTKWNPLENSICDCTKNTAKELAKLLSVDGLDALINASTVSGPRYIAATKSE